MADENAAHRFWLCVCELEASYITTFVEITRLPALTEILTHASNESARVLWLAAKPKRRVELVKHDESDLFTSLFKKVASARGELVRLASDAMLLRHLVAFSEEALVSEFWKLLTDDQKKGLIQATRSAHLPRSTEVFSALEGTSFLDEAQTLYQKLFPNR